MKSFAAAAIAVTLGLPLMAAPVEAQVYTSQYGAQSYGGQGYTSGCSSNCGDRRYTQGQRRYNSYNGQRDVPGDYRCDAYWDANRTDCNAAWRDQRPWRPTTQRRAYSSSYGYGYGYGGPAIYSGQYGGPDMVYSGNGYGQGYGQGGYAQGGRYPDPYGHDHSGYGQYGRDPQRINWCCAQYRSYDPATGYYTAYSGQHVFCG